MAATNSPGDASGFAAQFDQSITIATAAGGVVGDIGNLGLDLSRFSNSVDYAPWMSHGNYAPGSFSLALSGDGKSINLNYARAIPEPSSASLVVLGLGVLALNRRRCRR